MARPRQRYDDKEVVGQAPLHDFVCIGDLPTAPKQRPRLDMRR
jgi:hypothetical protein